MVEDEPLVARDIQSQLLDLGYACVGHATTGEDAIALADSLRPDLVLMDIQLAGEMDGITAAQAIRTQFALPVVFLTAFAERETLARAKHTEPFGYILKPFSDRELHTTIEMALYRHNVEQKLQRSEERLRLVLLGSTDAVWDHDLINGERFHSARWSEMLGYAAHELPALQDLWLHLMHPDDFTHATQLLAAAIAQATRHYQVEARLRHKAGHYVPVLSRGIIVRDPRGRAIRVAGTTTDLTERRASESTLRLHSATLNAAANSIVITDRQGSIEWANPAFCSLSGWSLAEAMGKNSRDLVKSGEHDPAFYRQMWDTLLAGKIWRGEIVNCRRDGTLRTEDMTITPLLDERGTITHFIAIKQDITDQKTMEAHFLQAQRMEAIGALAGGIAHDLNNILAPIMMVTGLLQEKSTDHTDREFLTMMQASAGRGAEIIKQLLTFSRGQDGERSLVQPRHLLNEIVLLMRETFPREIELPQRLPSSLWTVMADPTQLHQVLLNLCVNARDAMPAGGRLTLAAKNVTIVAGTPTLPPEAQSGPYLAISVSDTGHGVPPEIKHRIFEPFFTTKPVGKGTGLGLSTVLGIVRHHGGFVTLDSTPHVGSTFTVYLPAIPDGVATTTATPAPALLAAPKSGGQLILVVDDERDIRDTIRVVLERHHYHVVTASQGEDALTQYLRHRKTVRLVITDLMMPVMNGLTLIRTLHAIDPALKILAVSGLNDVAQHQELAALGVPEALQKPFDGPVLLAAVAHQLTEV